MCHEAAKHLSALSLFLALSLAHSRSFTPLPPFAPSLPPFLSLALPYFPSLSRALSLALAVSLAVSHPRLRIGELSHCSFLVKLLSRSLPAFLSFSLSLSLSLCLPLSSSLSPLTCLTLPRAHARRSLVLSFFLSFTPSLRLSLFLSGCLYLLLSCAHPCTLSHSDH